MTDNPTNHGPERSRLSLYGPARELVKDGVRVRLQEQCFQILQVLTMRPGLVVTRDELRVRLWPGDTIVDFEHSLNAAVKRLRAVLGDDAKAPRYIETLPRRGYRWIAESVHAAGHPSPLHDARSRIPIFWS